MTNKLVIVESPAKARTIGKFLGRGYKVEASNGHIRDLPKSQMGVDIDKVVNLIVPDEAITRRMSGRRVCAKCGASYHIVNKPSAKEGVCDRCGGELAIRKDDEPATVLDRLKAYHEQTEPLVEFYRQRGKLVEVPDQGSIEATTAFLLKLLEA